MADYIYLVELQIEEPELYGVQPHRLGFTTTATPQRVDPGDGTAPRAFGPGLVDVQVPGWRADLYAAGSASEGSASLTLSLEYFDALELAGAGVRLQHVKGLVYWWRPGWTLAQAVLVWIGRVRDPVIDITRGQFSASLVTATREIDAQFPPGFIGDADRFAAPPDSAKAQTLPVVYGTVTNLPIYPVSADPGPSPPAGVTSVRHIIAAHRIVEGQTFTARSDNGLAVAGLTPAHARDGRNQEYAYVDIPNTSSGWQQNAAVYLDSVQGYAGPGDRPIDRLGDVLQHLVTTYGRESFFDLDRTRMSGSRALLNRFKVACWFNAREPASVLRILRGRFESQFPVAFGYTGGKFGWDYAGIPPGDKPVATITWGQNAHVRGTLAPVSVDQLRARFEVQYAADGYAAGTTASERRDETNSAVCKAALARHKIELRQVLTTPDVPDVYTAGLLIEDQVQRLAFMRWRTSYVVDDPALLTLPRFARVHVTDPGWGWTAKRCLVEGIQPVRPGRVRLDVITEDGD